MAERIDGATKRIDSPTPERIDYRTERVEPT
jgi:hypothetical protein